MRPLKLAAFLIVFLFVFGFNVVAQTKKIGKQKATEIATKQAAGKIESSELEREKGKLVYSFDIRTQKGTITEVQVDAYSGQVTSVEEENAEKEAAEKKTEKAAKKTKH